MKYLHTYNEKYEQKIDLNDLEIFVQKKQNYETFIYFVFQNNPIGGIYFSNSVIETETQLSVMKVAIDKKHRGNGILGGNKDLGLLLYLSAMIISDKKGLSPHRRSESTRIGGQGLWNKLNKLEEVRRVTLDEKLYDNRELMDSKYFLKNCKLKQDIINRMTFVNIDPFDRTNKNANISWSIVDGEMNKKVKYEKY